MKKNLKKAAGSAKLAAVMALGAGALAACGGSDGPGAQNNLPTGITVQDLSIGNTMQELPIGISVQGMVVYPATARGAGDTAATQDLLTAGLGRTGLGGAAPAYANPLAPTALELRRNAIHGNYRGLVDVTEKGGYGTLYGPKGARTSGSTI